jgi:hypothetical protein
MALMLAITVLCTVAGTSSAQNERTRESAGPRLSPAAATTVGDTNVTAKKKPAPAPTFVGCGAAAVVATDKALDVFVKKVRPALTKPNSAARLFAGQRVLSKLETKRASAYTRFLDCIRPLAGADPVPAAATAAQRSAISLGGAEPNVPFAGQAPADCLAVFDGARNASIAAFTQNLPAISTDTTFPTFDTAALVIDDLRVRISLDLADLYGCVGGTVTPASAPSSPCTTAFLSAVNAADTKLSATTDSIDASSAPATQKGLDRGYANAAFGDAITAATAALNACAKQVGKGARKASDRLVRSGKLSPFAPNNDPPLPPPSFPHPEPDPAPPTKAECRTIGSEALKGLASTVQGFIDSYIEGVESLGTDTPEKEPKELAELLTHINRFIQLIFEIIAVRAFCLAVAREAGSG